MLDARPNDRRALFGLALEYERLRKWDEVVGYLQRYLASGDDEGNAYGRLARALLALGRHDEGIAAYREGIAAASRHGHPTLAMELEEELEDVI